jgi:hypothetical protein
MAQGDVHKLGALLACVTCPQTSTVHFRLQHLTLCPSPSIPKIAAKW